MRLIINKHRQNEYTPITLIPQKKALGESPERDRTGERGEGATTDY